MFALSIKSNSTQLTAALSAVATKQLPFALASALNDTAKDVVTDNKRLMESVFDRPSSFTLNAFYAGPFATSSKLSVTVQRKDKVVGRHYLEVQEKGGPRGYTGFENLMNFSVIQNGTKYHMIPGDGAKLDKNGNWSNAERQQVLSALGAQRDQAQNTTAASRKRNKNSASYFVPRHGLPPGVYRRTKAGILDIVIAFVITPPTYQARLPFQENGTKVGLERFPINFANRFNAAMASAR